MPRKQFVEDLRTARVRPPAGIISVDRGDDDGQFVFRCAAGDDIVNATALVPELGDYPTSHEYVIFFNDDVPSHIVTVIQDLNTRGKTPSRLLEMVAARLSGNVCDGDGDAGMPDPKLEHEGDEEYDAEGPTYSDDEYGFDTAMPAPSSSLAAATPASANAAEGKHLRKCILSDLSLAKEAGFKIGHMGSPFEGSPCYITVATRIAKLGISEEAMHAWGVDPMNYLILIMHYPRGYKTFSELQRLDTSTLQQNIGMRVVAGTKYKPATLHETIKFFTKFAKKDLHDSGYHASSQESLAQTSSTHDTMVSKPLANLLEERLIPILRFRSSGMDWQGAEKCYHLQATTDINTPTSDCFIPEPRNHMLTGIVTADHFSNQDLDRTFGRHYELSFPLLAMQFTLRHFVHCTKFCVVCHRKLEDDLEAIKPYVCDSHLCLFQYMAMGLGPSIEHEIVTQPYVVDLLVSFCYSAASAGKLQDFPRGLAITVPEPSQSNSLSTSKPECFGAGFDRERFELFFDKASTGICPVRPGQWIYCRDDGLGSEQSEMHCRVAETTFFPLIKLDAPVHIRRASVPSREDWSGKYGKKKQASRNIPVTPAATPRYVKTGFYRYNKDFDDLADDVKRRSICHMLDTLPSVKEMRQYLTRDQGAHLTGWTERISPAALSLLRWIIASNRACIMQTRDSTTPTEGMERSTKDERISGMGSNYLQFRFAMGAPDKEQRFINAVRATAARLNLEYPTMFAWHGSPLHNWHNIIREGLNFDQTTHGRAYGHGVYHATDAFTSTHYSSGYGMGLIPGDRAGEWTNTALRISSALALNEIVNAPDEFRSKSPHYVVQHVDWIQTRFLFVHVVGKGVPFGEDSCVTDAFKQDPKRIPTGTFGPVVIPASSVKSLKTNKKQEGKGRDSPDRFAWSPPKKRLRGDGTIAYPVLIDDDVSSDTTDEDDWNILQNVLETDIQNSETQSKDGAKVGAPTTDFQPGTLDFKHLPLMPEPAYANPMTTKRLLNELKSLTKVQESTPAGELGWYMDVDRVENVYQWIVELHSFHNLSDSKGNELALVKDMKAANVKSVVLEIRFGSDYPFSPPYVRVLQPRFLGFNQGGGGHIVVGGAMCMELLTNSGWSSVMSMASVLMQVRLAIASEPPARLDMYSVGKNGKEAYAVGEAADGYIRACKAHGWAVPPGFKEVAYNGPAALLK